MDNPTNTATLAGPDEFAFRKGVYSEEHRCLVYFEEAYPGGPSLFRFGCIRDIHLLGGDFIDDSPRFVAPTRETTFPQEHA